MHKKWNGKLPFQHTIHEGLPISERYMRERWASFLSQDKKGTMLIEGISVTALAHKYGTPLYIMVESEIRSRLRRFKKVFGNQIKLQYAVKCNSNLEILRIVREEGFELDCSSVGEVILGLLADFKPKQITLTNLYKSEQDLLFAVQLGLQSITADSLEEIEHIAKAAKKMKKHIDTTLRVNPMLEVGSYTTKNNKYGIPAKEIREAVSMAHKYPYVDFHGFHFMGGYVYSPKVFKAAARYFVKLIKELQESKISVKSLSLGGGFPAAIGDQKAFPIEDMSDFSKYWKELITLHGIEKPPRLIFEPGKSITLNAGIGLARVISHKRIGKKRMVIVDGSTYNFIPDAIIQKDIFYDVLPASKLKFPRIHKVTIAGNTCDCWDIITSGIQMPKLEAGDFVTIMDVGAYAHVMASNFNTIRKPAMIMIYTDGTTRMIKRRDRFSEMFAPELDVLKMADPNELEHYHNLYRVNIDRIWKDTQGKQKNKETRIHSPTT